MFHRLDNSGVVPVMLELLAIPHGPANAALRHGCGNVVLLNWLRDHYNTCCENERVCCEGLFVASNWMHNFF